MEDLQKYNQEQVESMISFVPVSSMPKHKGSVSLLLPLTAMAGTVPVSLLGAAGSIAFEGLGKIITILTSAAGAAMGSGGFIPVDAAGIPLNISRLMRSNTTGNIIGTIAQSNGAVGGGIAQWIPARGGAASFISGLSGLADFSGVTSAITTITLSATMLVGFTCVIGMLKSIDKKIVRIEETQHEILDFLHADKSAQVAGDLRFLTDLIENFKFNCSNDLYCENAHLKVLDLKQAADRDIQLSKSLINSSLAETVQSKANKNPRQFAEKMHQLFAEYRKAVYLYSFASYAEVLTLKNYESGFLASVSNLIRMRQFDYLIAYTNVCDRIDRLTDKTVGSVVSRVSSAVSKKTGEFIEKTPLVKTQLDENLGAMGSTLDRLSASRRDKNIRMFNDDRGSFVAPFLEGLHELDIVFNHGDELYIDSSGIYVISNQTE